MVILGVDVGGTNVKVGAIDDQGRVICRHDQSLREKTPSTVIEAIVEVSNLVLRKIDIGWSEVKYIGIGFPGLVENGMVVKASNFPEWDHVKVAKLVSEATKRPAAIFNDADAAIAAELWVGVAKHGFSDFVMITLGTGVGMGVVVNNIIVEGGTKLLEGGHMIIEKNGRACGCSQNGCLEMYGSANAVARQAEERCQESSTTSRLQSMRPLTSKKVFEAADAGDKLALEIIDEAADYLGLACVNIARILDTQAIVFSGGMAEAGRSLIEKIRKHYVAHAWTTLPNPVKIMKSEVGYDAGIIGAAALAKKHFANTQNEKRLKFHISNVNCSYVGTLVAGVLLGSIMSTCIRKYLSRG